MYKKTVVQVTVLSDDDFHIDQLSLNQIAYLISDGECSGLVEVVSDLEISGQQMAEECKKQGTDPSFFFLDENGDQLDL